MIAVGRSGEQVVLFVDIKGKPTPVAVTEAEAHALHGQLTHLLGLVPPASAMRALLNRLDTQPAAPQQRAFTPVADERTGFAGAATEAAAADAAALRARIAAANAARDAPVSADAAPVDVDGDAAIVEARRRAAEEARELRRARAGRDEE